MIDAVARALDAIEIRSVVEYAWLGESVALAARGLERAGDEIRRRVLVQSIASRLYNDFFTVGGPQPSQRRQRHCRRRLAARLAEANCGRGSFDDGWAYRRRDGDWHVVERRDLSVWVAEEDLRTAGAGGPPRPGDVVAIRWGKDAPFVSPGFYMALSDVGFVAPRPQPLDRFYLNVGPSDAFALMERATRRLNDAGLAFRLKIVDDPDGFDRCDTAVLVVQQRDRTAGFAEVLDLYADVAHLLRPGVPSMTLPLRPGLAFAEDPDAGRSFGAHRCDLLAEAAVEAYERGVEGASTRLAIARNRFASAGIALETPYLGGMADPSLPDPRSFAPEELQACR